MIMSGKTINLNAPVVTFLEFDFLKKTEAFKIKLN